MTEFNLLEWSSKVPLADDLWLGMQLRNIAIVDFAIIRDIEDSVLKEYIETERTPSETLLILSSVSQLWIYGLYEFFRTWRQRARELLRLSKKYNQLDVNEKAKFLEKQLEEFQARGKLIRVAPTWNVEHLEKIDNPGFVGAVRRYFEASESIFRDVEGLRVTLAKHEVPKTSGLIAEAPGYGRMSYETGSMYWFFRLKDGSHNRVDRREVADRLYSIDSQSSKMLRQLYT